MFSEIFQNSHENTCAHLSFKQRCTPVALLTRDSSTDAFPWILWDILEHPFCIGLSMLYKTGILKNLAKFTAKFMWTAVSGISEHRPCLVGCKFIDVLKNWM